MTARMWCKKFLKKIKCQEKMYFRKAANRVNITTPNSASKAKPQNSTNAA